MGQNTLNPRACSVFFDMRMNILISKNATGLVIEVGDKSFEKKKNYNKQQIRFYST